MKTFHRLTALLFSSFLLISTSLFSVANESTEVNYDTTKPWARWWWPGSAVDKQSLTHQLESLKEAGIGGVEITPIYGARGYEDRNIDYLSEDWN